MSQNTLQKNHIVFLLAMLCCLLWGSAFPCIKIGYQLFQVEGYASQILFAGVRFFFAGVLTLLIGSLTQRKLLLPKKSQAPVILLMALCQTILQYFFFYVGLAHTSGVKSSIISGSQQFFAILLATLLFRQESLTSRKFIGCLFGFLGVIFINLNGSGIDASFAWNGEMFMFISALSSAFSSVFIKKFSQNHDPVLLSGSQFCLGGFLLAITGWGMGGSLAPIRMTAYILLFYMACISAVAYSIWAILLKYNPVSRVTVFGFMNPIFGVFLSALLLKENEQAFSLKSLISLLLVCLGIYIVNKNPEKQR